VGSVLLITARSRRKRLKQFNRVVEEIAEERALVLVDLRGMGPECYADGVHLTNAGNREVARRIAVEIIAKRGFDLGEELKKIVKSEDPQRIGLCLRRRR